MKIISSIITAVTIVLLGGITQAQTNTFPTSGAAGIGTTSPNASSLLEVKSTTKGVLISRMTKAQRDAIVSPATGLLIYQTNSTPGFYYWNGTAWTAVASGGANTGLSNLTATAINQSLLPNASGTLNLGNNSFKWKDVYVTNIKFADGTTQSTAGGGGGSEIDPQVGTNTTNYIPKWDGSALVTGVLQDNGTNLWTGSPAFAGTRAKLDLYNTTTLKGLNIENSMTTTSQTEGIHSWIQSSSTGSKYGFYNSVWQSNSGTGEVYGTYNDIQNWGTGTGYGLKNTFDLVGSATNYGVYTSMSGNSGVQYGTYTSLSSSGSQYGHYVTLGSSSGNHYGFFVTSTGTTGSHYGLFSQVSTSNTAAYSAYLVGKIYASGNVGIGTTTPATKLHIVDAGTSGATANSNADLVVEDNTKAYINILTPDAYENGILFGTPTSSADGAIVFNATAMSKGLEFRTGGNSTKMSITSAGDVCINTTTPATGYKLSVYGKIICEELKVQLHADWPDYVFTPDYSLQSISDLKSFIAENKHLPGIPSATEIQEQGISVGDMQTKMMQKIEELSLYIIQLQNEIDELKSAQK